MGMDTINFLLLTEVKAKNISTVEKIGNFFLTPAQYLWNGKKIDFIQEFRQKAPEFGQKAAQIDFIYTSDDRSWLKATFMVILLIPGTLLGGACKTYAACRYHVQEDDEFMKKCLRKGEMGKIFTPKGQSKFGEKIKAFIDESERQLRWNQHRILFLSELEYVSLRYVQNHMTISGVIQAYNDEAAERNDLILSNIHFLWNLSDIHLADYYDVFPSLLIGEEVKSLEAINPNVTFFDSMEKKCVRGLKAKDFFSQQCRKFLS